MDFGMNILDELLESYTFKGVISTKAIEDDIVTLENQIDSYNATLNEIRIRRMNDQPIVSKIREAKIHLSLLKAAQKRAANKVAQDEIILDMLGVSANEAKEAKIPETAASGKEPLPQDFKTAEYETVQETEIDPEAIRVKTEGKDYKIVIEEAPLLGDTPANIEVERKNPEKTAATYEYETAPETMDEANIDLEGLPNDGGPIIQDVDYDEMGEIVYNSDEVFPEYFSTAEAAPMEEREVEVRPIEQISSLEFHEAIDAEEEAQVKDSETVRSTPAGNDTDAHIPEVEEKIEEKENELINKEIDKKITDKKIVMHMAKQATQSDAGIIEGPNSIENGNLDAPVIPNDGPGGGYVPTPIVTDPIDTDLHPVDSPVVNSGSTGQGGDTTVVTPPFTDEEPDKIYTSVDLRAFTKLPNSNNVSAAYDPKERTIDVFIEEIKDYPIFMTLLKQYKRCSLTSKNRETIFMTVTTKVGKTVKKYNYEFRGCKLIGVQESQLCSEYDSSLKDYCHYHGCVATFKYKKLVIK